MNVRERNPDRKKVFTFEQSSISLLPSNHQNTPLSHKNLDMAWHIIAKFIVKIATLRLILSSDIFIFPYAKQEHGHAHFDLTQPKISTLR